MSEIPQSSIFTESSQNYFLVQFDNIGNSMVPVGNPAVIKNYAKDVGTDHAAGYGKEFLPKEGLRNYVMVNKNGDYLSHVSIQFNSTFRNLFENNKPMIASIPYVDYPTHIISNITVYRYHNTGICETMLNIIVNNIFNNTNNIPFSLYYSHTNYNVDLCDLVAVS